jgi:hypothetical protein
VERGEDPLGVIRNPAENEVIRLNLEGPAHNAVGTPIQGRDRTPFSVNREMDLVRR